MTHHCTHALVALLALSSCAADLPAGDDDPGTPDGGTTERCTHPISGDPVELGATIETYTISAATSQSECDAARVTSTCVEGGTFSPAPASSPRCEIETLPPAGLGFYFADCATGAAAGCVPGNDAADGLSPATAKRSLAGFDFDALPAGAHVLLARGGAWAQARIEIENPNVTPAMPLVIRPYGSGPAPLLRSTGDMGFQLGGRWNNTTNDGGYVLRDLRLDGQGTAQWGIWLVQNVTAVTLESLEISGFDIAIHASHGEPYNVNHVTVRASNFHHNSDMGYLGSVDDSTFEGNTFEANNFSGSALSHAIYMSNGSRNVIRNNRFVRNSVVDGRCTGGNVTFHGVIDGLTIEGNRIEQDAGSPGCYGFSITAGYTTPERFDNVIVRNNVVRNVGNCAVCIDSAPGALIEGNVSVNQHGTFHVGVMQPPNGDEDVQTTGLTIRNNTTCQQNPPSGSDVVRVAATDTTMSNNTFVTGTAATSGVCAP